MDDNPYDQLETYAYAQPAPSAADVHLPASLDSLEALAKQMLQYQEARDVRVTTTIGTLAGREFLQLYQARVNGTLIAPPLGRASSVTARTQMQQVDEGLLGPRSPYFLLTSGCKTSSVNFIVNGRAARSMSLCMAQWLDAQQRNVEFGMVCATPHSRATLVCGLNFRATIDLHALHRYDSKTRVRRNGSTADTRWVDEDPTTGRPRAYTHRIFRSGAVNTLGVSACLQLARVVTEIIVLLQGANRLTGGRAMVATEDPAGGSDAGSTHTGAEGCERAAKRAKVAQRAVRPRKIRALPPPVSPATVSLVRSLLAGLARDDGGDGGGEAAADDDDGSDSGAESDDGDDWGDGEDE